MDMAEERNDGVLTVPLCVSSKYESGCIVLDWLEFVDAR